MKKAGLLVLLVMICLSSFAQNTLIHRQKGKRKSTTFLPGMQMKVVQLKGAKLRGNLTYVGVDHIVIGKSQINLSDIKAIKLSRNTLGHKIGGIQLGIMGLPVTMNANKRFIANKKGKFIILTY